MNKIFPVLVWWLVVSALMWASMSLLYSSGLISFYPSLFQAFSVVAAVRAVFAAWTKVDLSGVKP